MKILTVCFGGEWNCEGQYIGNVSSKAVVIKENIKLEDLRTTIMQRCKVDSGEKEISLSHLNPFQTINHPYTVESDDDFLSFLEINASSEVQWKMALFVTLRDKNRRINDNLIDGASSVNLLTTNELPNSSIDTNYQVVQMEEFQSLDAQDMQETDEEDYVDDVLANNDFLRVGQLYPSKEDLKSAVQNLALRERFGYRVQKSTKQVYKLKCVDSECSWLLMAARVKDSKYFEIRKYTSKHSCSFYMRSQKHHKPSYLCVAEKIKTKFEGMKNGPDAFQIQNDVQKEYHERISYWKTRKAREKAQDLIRGSPEENYALLASYCHMLKQVNVGTYKRLVIENSNQFKYVFVAFGASIRGFQHMRKVISVDGSFLHGKYGGNLMSVVAQDANHQVYPLAFAVVDLENDDAWKWFFEQLRNVVPCSPDLVVLSDRHMSIKNAVANVYNEAKHVYCRRHLKENLKTKFHDNGVLTLFSQAADAYTTREFEGYFQDICKISPEMGKYLVGADFKKWSRTYCENDRYNMMTTYNSEYVNAALKIARSYQLVALFEFIREMVTRSFQERGKKATKYPNQPSKQVRIILEERHKISKRYDIKPLNDAQFQVSGGSFSGIVDLIRKKCSCRVFDLDHIPCAHAISAIEHMQYKMTDFISGYYTSDSWFKAYQETIYPLPSRSEWDVPEDIAKIQCVPPKVHKKSGRPRTNRLPSVEEFAKNVKKKKKKPCTYKCSSCGNGGHNKKRCPNKFGETNTSYIENCYKK